jgi:hypothetical protein
MICDMNHEMLDVLGLILPRPPLKEKVLFDTTDCMQQP